MCGSIGSMVDMQSATAEIRRGKTKKNADICYAGGHNEEHWCVAGLKQFFVNYGPGSCDTMRQHAQIPR